jgi:hypothetical protein
MTQPHNLQEQTEQLLQNGAPIVFSKRSWLQRLLIIPYEIAFLAFAIFCGAASIFHYGQTNTVFALALPQSALYNILLVLGAVATGLGAARRRYDIEAAGLIVLAAQLVIRAIVLLPNTDGSATNSVVLWVLMAAACVARLRGVLTRVKGHVDILISND